MAGETIYNRVNIRKSHPNMYRSIMGVAFWQVMLWYNFWFERPTFNPWGWHKIIIGAAFLVIGVNQIVVLNWRHDLRAVRLGVAASVGWMLFWGVSNAQQWWNDKASLQLPFMFFMASTSQVWWLREAAVNPITSKQ